MGLWDKVTHALAVAPEEHPLRILATPGPPAPTPEELRLQRIARQAAPRPWRPASVNEALGVPAFLRAVMLISNIMGIFTLDGYKNGARVPEAERPRIIVRPNPFTTLRDYLRDTGWSMATRGENWQWIGSRDAEGVALSLIPVPSYEVEVEGDWLLPTVRWRKSIRTPDMRAVWLTKELGATRGKGPLQYCGAAISAAVESQQWAANFYADGGNPSVHIHSETELDGDEALALRTAWVDTPSNMPQVTAGLLSVEQLGGPSEGAAQMLESRNWNAGEAARSFGIPGALLEYARGGSSLTYQNVVTLMDQFLKQCLIPDYLEPVEQMISDVLPRSWITRFNVDAILRADIKTRFEVYESGLRSGVYPDATIPQRAEGILPGGVENAPVPFSPPSAMPAGIPARALSAEWRCESCGKKLAERRGSGTALMCRCGTLAIA